MSSIGNIVIDDMELITNGNTGLILGIIASLMTLALHLYSVPKFWAMLDNNTNSALKLLLYQFVFASNNAYVWFAYGMSSSFIPPYDKEYDTEKFQVYCLILVNLIAVVLEHLYMLIYHQSHELGTFKKLLMSFTMCQLWYWFFIPNSWLMALKDIIWPSMYIIATMMYVSPVFTIIHVYQTKLVELLPFQLLMMLCLNGLAWTIYSAQTYDFYLVISNGVGTICAISLLGVAYYIRFKLRRINANEHIHDDGSNDDLEKQLLLVK